MPNVKWHAIPPVKGPDSQGVTIWNLIRMNKKQRNKTLRKS